MKMCRFYCKKYSVFVPVASIQKKLTLCSQALAKDVKRTIVSFAKLEDIEESLVLNTKCID